MISAGEFRVCLQTADVVSGDEFPAVTGDGLPLFSHIRACDHALTPEQGIKHHSPVIPGQAFLVGFQGEVSVVTAFLPALAECVFPESALCAVFRYNTALSSRGGGSGKPPQKPVTPAGGLLTKRSGRRMVQTRDAVLIWSG